MSDIIILWGLVAIPAALICTGIVTAISNAIGEAKPTLRFDRIPSVG